MTKTSTKSKTSNTKKIIRQPDLPAYIGLSRSTIYSKRNPDSTQFDPTFPPAIKLSARTIGFDLDSIDAWLASKAQGGN
jgi:prophage regulatory protein